MIKYIQSLKENIDDIKSLISDIRSSDIISLDTETSGLDPFIDKVLIIQIGIGENIYVVNRGAVGKTFSTNLIHAIKERNALCLGHNIKFDIKMLATDTGVMLSNVYDTMLAETILTAGIGNKFVPLKDLVLKYCGVELEKETQTSFIGMNWESVFTEQQIMYSAKDVLHLKDIFNKQVDQIIAVKSDRVLEIEKKIEPIVASMELEGITLDVPYFRELTDKARIRADELKIETVDLIFSNIDTSKYENAFDFATAVAIPVKTKRLTTALQSVTDPALILDWAKEQFNLGSHKQLLTILNLIGIKTASTDEKVLNKLPKNPIIDTILDYRGYEKMISTYGYNIIDAINPVTGRIHADFNQLGTASGRFSSSGGVNMQNIPTKHGYREGFIAREGYSLVACDYSQQEYRLAGAISKEPKIIEAYAHGYDMHTATAALRFGKDLKDVTKDERSAGKAVNFTILYGGTEYALGKNLNMSQDDALDILAQFLSNYPVLAAHKEASEKKIAELGYSVTLMGRRRYWKPLGPFATPKEINNHVNMMKREGYNHIIQGTGADVTKLAMLGISERNPFGSDKYHLLLQIHDELVAEVHDSILDDAVAFMKYEMESAFQPFLGSIPALVDTKISKRWTKG